MFLQEAQDALFFIGGVDGDGHQVQAAIAVHEERILQIGELGNAGAAPCRPKVDKRIFIAAVCAQLF